MGSVVHLPPRGRYLAQEVGQLAGVSGAKVGQWANYGYIRASQSEPGAYPKVYSFQDAAEAILVHELIERKVPLRVLRPIIESLRETRGDWPLQHVQLEALAAPGVSAASLLVREGELRLELGEHGWQIVEHTMIRPERVAADLRRGGWASRELPELQYVSVDPDYLSGRPAISGRRVPVSLVAELAAQDDGTAILREDYGLTDDEVNDAVAWWKAASAYEQAA